MRMLLILTAIPFMCLSCQKLEKRETRYPNGQFKVQYSEKQDSKGNYVKHGKYIGWHRNGKKKTEGRYIDGKRNGRWVVWNRSGRKLREASFERGNISGKGIVWWPNGRKAKEENFKIIEDSVSVKVVVA